MTVLRGNIIKLLFICLISLPLFTKAHVPINLQELFIENEKYNLSFSPHKITVKNEIHYFSIYPDRGISFIDFALGDIDIDGKDEILILEGDEESTYGQNLIIFKLFREKDGLLLREIYRNNLGLIRPWKIETCEIDNDGRLEIFIAVNKSTKYYTEVANRPFFFNFKDDILVKKWTGSRVRAPFKDVCFADLSGNGRDEFIVIEELDNGKSVIAVYYWFGFGFILQAESNQYDSIDSISVFKSKEGDILKVKVTEVGKSRVLLLEPSKDMTENNIYLLRER